AAPAKPGILPLPPDSECKAGYLLVGSAKLHGAGYENPDVRLHDVDGGAQLHITPSELLLTALSGYLPGGGSAAGELRIVNWLGEPQATAAVSATTKAAVKTANTTAESVHSKATAHAPTPPPTVGYAHAY